MAGASAGAGEADLGDRRGVYGMMANERELQFGVVWYRLNSFHSI